MNKIYYLTSLLLMSIKILGMSQETSIEMTDFKQIAKRQESLNMKLIRATHLDITYELKELIEQGADVNYQFPLWENNTINCSTLHFSIFVPSPNCIDVLLQNKNLKILDLPDYQNRTPLLFAILLTPPNLDIIKKIIKAGANLNSNLSSFIGRLRHMIKLNEIGIKDYDESYINDCFDVIPLFLNYGFTPLMCSVSQKDYFLVETLIDLGANLNLENNQRFTALMLAVCSGEIKIIEKLLKHKANLFNSEGRNFIEYARNKNIEDGIFNSDSFRSIQKKYIKDNNLLPHLIPDLSNIVCEYI